jgi:hypothetical protein
MLHTCYKLLLKIMFSKLLQNCFQNRPIAKKIIGLVRILKMGYRSTSRHSYVEAGSDSSRNVTVIIVDKKSTSQRDTI